MCSINSLNLLKKNGTQERLRRHHTPFPGRQPRLQLFKMPDQDPLVENEQGWKLGNDILDINFFACQATGKIKKFELDFNISGLFL